MNRLKETGKLLRLLGPLIQLPSLWLLTQRPEFAASNMNLIYGLFFCGLGMVIAGLLMSLSLRSSKK